MDGYWQFADIDSSDEKELKIKIENIGGHSKMIKEPYWTRRLGMQMRCKLQYTPNHYYHMSDKKVKDFFANKIKQVLKIEFESQFKNIWKRDNTNTTINYLQYKEMITVADCYKAYDILKERKLKVA